MTTTTAHSPPTQAANEIRIDVEFYDAHHEAQLLAHQNQRTIRQLVSEGIRIPTNEFIVHSIFTEQKNYDGWRTYQDLKRHFPDRVAEFRDYFDTTGGTVRARFDPLSTGTGRTERIGVSTALAAMNRIFGLHEADWQQVAIGQTKTLDFWIASDGNQFIEVEAKGAVVEDVSRKSPAISKAKKSIEDKKVEQRSEGTTSRLFGTIAAIPMNTSQRVRCLLLDPPGDSPPMSPDRFQLLARLAFYLDRIRLFSQLRMLIALANRIRALEVLRDYNELNEVGLVDGRGEPIRVYPGILHDKTTLLRERVVGRVFPIGAGEYMFYGFDLAVFDVLVEQNFENVARFKSTIEGNTPLESVDCLIDERDLDRFRELPGRERRWRSIPLSGELTVNASGLATAFLHEHT